MRSVTVSFPGGERVDAHFHTFTVHTDQRRAHGGEESAPSPFDYYFVAIATCAGSSALGYCQKHNLDTDALQIDLHASKHPTEPRFDTIIISVTPPPLLTEAQREGLRASVENCTVKRHILQPPSFETVLQPGTPAPR